MIVSCYLLFVNGFSVAQSAAAGGRRLWVLFLLLIAQAAIAVEFASAPKYTSSGVRYS